MTQFSVPLFVTDRDAAELLAVSRATIWRWSKAGVIPQPVRIAGVTRWRRDALIAAIEQADA